MADDTDEFEKHNYLIMLYKVHESEQELLNFVVWTGLANETTECEEHS